MDTGNKLPHDAESGSSNQISSENSTALWSDTSSDASSDVSSEVFSRSSSKTSSAIEPELSQGEDEDNHDEDENDGEDEVVADDDMSFSYYDDRYQDESHYDDSYVEDPDDDWRPGEQHPRCIYEEIGRRDAPGCVKDQHSVACPELKHQWWTAQVKKFVLIGMREAATLSREEDMDQEQWEQLLLREYQRQARALLDALEADLAYFRTLLGRLVKAASAGRLKMPPTTYWRFDTAAIHRIHDEVGCTRAEILILRLRDGPLLRDFMDAFRTKRYMTPADWGHTDKLIPLYRMPSSWNMSVRKENKRTRMMKQEKMKADRQAMADWGWKRGRYNGRRVWVAPSRKMVAGVKTSIIDRLVPTCITEEHAQHLFGHGTPHVWSARNAIPGLGIGVGVGVGVGLLAPAVVSRDKYRMMEDDEFDRMIAAAESPSSSPPPPPPPPPPSREQWLNKDLRTASREDYDENYPRFSLKEFGTPHQPVRPDQRYAYFHLLLNLFKEQRFRDADLYWRSDPNAYRRNAVIIREMLHDDRWKSMTAAGGLRQSTVRQMARTIGLIDIDEPAWAFRTAADGVDVAPPEEARASDELDMLIVNIVEEHLFPSPGAILPDGAKHRPPVFGETDIVAEMQRRKPY